MKFTTIFTIVAAAAATVSATSGAETNAERMARGLPPLPPTRRSGARRATPSSTPQTCSTGPVQCCNSITNASDAVASLIAGLLGLVLDPSLVVGLTCTPVSVAGGSGTSCNAQTVCCQNNNYNGIIALGCTPLNLNA
ncbi:hypothetical protein H0H92_015336 [Tricholoma furcatifolium]|nr:hypothetical protein H0H92_015336 [Tricholoma furcatifolium]